MRKVESEEMLCQNLHDLHLARMHLDYSYSQVKSLPEEIADCSPDQLESAEAFTSRFARVVDLLVNKILRALDRLELLPQGSLLDVIDRAEKRLFIESSMTLREMKQVRNIIAHDYTGEKFAEILTYCAAQKLILDEICNKTQEYAEQLLDRLRAN